MTGDSNQQAPRGGGVADVLAPVAVDTAYSYRIPADFNLRPGQFVEIPLGSRHTTGVVWAVHEGASGDNLFAEAMIIGLSARTLGTTGYDLCRMSA